MKKIVFFQVSIILYIGLALLVSILAGCVYVAIEFLRIIIKNAGAFEWAVFVAALAGVVFLAYIIVRIVKNRIVLDVKEIFVPGMRTDKADGIQYETHIKYLEIQEIFIISSDKNSLNMSARWVFTPMPYIVFNCKNDIQKSINVFYYSKKQVIQIIDETVLRAKQLGNELLVKTGKEILLEFLTLQKKKK